MQAVRVAQLACRRAASSTHSYVAARALLSTSRLQFAKDDQRPGYGKATSQALGANSGESLLQIFSKVLSATHEASKPVSNTIYPPQGFVRRVVHKPQSYLAFDADYTKQPPLVDKFICLLMQDGKKATATRIFNETMKVIKTRHLKEYVFWLGSAPPSMSCTDTVESSYNTFERLSD
eukprot:m.17573 g.17573  ORF g.17573 m.17573 type:complete len:178 (-) comp7508_c0_seq1:761-1294(-)